MHFAKKVALYSQNMKQIYLRGEKISDRPTCKFFPNRVTRKMSQNIREGSLFHDVLHTMGCKDSAQAGVLITHDFTNVPLYLWWPLKLSLCNIIRLSGKMHPYRPNKRQSDCMLCIHTNFKKRRTCRNCSSRQGRLMHKIDANQRSVNTMMISLLRKLAWKSCLLLLRSDVAMVMLSRFLVCSCITKIYLYVFFSSSIRGRSDFVFFYINFITYTSTVLIN